MSGRVLVIGLVAALAVVPFEAHQQQAPPSFRSRLDLVHLDISVLDKNRRPVTGLTAADFTVLEDGQPQPISVFSAIDVPPPAPEPPAKWLREVTPDVQTNVAAEQPEGRLFVIMIDDGMLPPDQAAVKNAKKIARGIVERMGPLDQAAVVFSFRGRQSQNFTRDRSKLFTAIDSLVTGAATHLLGWDTPLLPDPGLPRIDTFEPRNTRQVPAVDNDMTLRMASLRTLKMVAETLIKAPQRRKALFFVSPGIAVDFASNGQFAAMPNSYSGEVGFAIREVNRELSQETPRTFRSLANANVTVYPIDPCGLDGLKGYVLGAAGSLLALFNAQPVPALYNWLAPTQPPQPLDLARHVAEVNMDFLVEAAKNTGGRTVVNTNDFDPGLDAIFEENRSYYLVGYVKPTQTKPGHLHRVKVSVNRPGVTVRTREAYEVERPDPQIDDPGILAMVLAGNGPVPSSGLPLNVAVAPVGVVDGPNGRDAAVTIAIGLGQPRVKVPTPQTIYFQVALFTPDGTRVGGVLRHKLDFTLGPGRGDLVWYDALTQLPVKPGRYELRVAAHRATDNASGSVFADVVVPDFAKAPVSLSGVWLTAASGPTGLPRDAFAAFVAVPPTSSREFERRDDLTAYFRIYQGGNRVFDDVPLTMRLVNEKDEVVATTTGTITAAQFNPDTRSAEHRFFLPLRFTPPGRYLLTFEATLGETTARRDVIFTVR